ncbi:hypothetical protein LUZ60_003493 [Juncus effusus]|nr:hypothetical protein LUZ60_003493 [Juncus effusus]
MVCILQSVIAPYARSFSINGSSSTFTAMEYNATVEFYWAPFLLESNSDDAIVIDFLIESEGSFDDEEKHVLELSTEDAYSLAIASVLAWVKEYMDLSKTRVFFTCLLLMKKISVTFLNITQLSSYRKDAHTSIYKKQWSLLTPEQLANPVSYADCVHWCLPGLQETWNELLFVKLFYS